MRRGSTIYSPDHIIIGYYCIGDIVDYFTQIREKWNQKKLEEIRGRVHVSIIQTRLAYQSTMDSELPPQIKKNIEHAIEKLLNIENRIKK